jgi:hypothetical protein
MENRGATETGLHPGVGQIINVVPVILGLMMLACSLTLSNPVEEARIAKTRL